MVEVSAGFPLKQVKTGLVKPTEGALADILEKAAEGWRLATVGMSNSEYSVQITKTTCDAMVELVYTKATSNKEKVGTIVLQSQVSIKAAKKPGKSHKITGPGFVGPEFTGSMNEYGAKNYR